MRFDLAEASRTEKGELENKVSLRKIRLLQIMGLQYFDTVHKILHLIP